MQFLCTQRFCMAMLELKLVFNFHHYHSEGTTTTISFHPEENLLFIRNHQELISDKWATIEETDSCNLNINDATNALGSQ